MFQASHRIGEPARRSALRTHSPEGRADRYRREVRRARAPGYCGIAGFVVVGPAVVGARHVLALNKNAKAVIFGGNCAVGFQFLTHGQIQLAARGTVGRDDQGIRRRLRMVPGNGTDTLLWIGNLSNAALLLEQMHGCGGLDAGIQFHRELEGRIFLADDLIEFGGVHSGILQLLEEPPAPAFPAYAGAARNGAACAGQYHIRL